MIKVKIYMESDIAHTYQVYTGLCMLRDQGLIDLEMVSGKGTNTSIIQLEVDHKRVAFDLSDTSEFQSKEIVESSDLYFKRMLLKENETKKIKPFGLNYPVLYKHDNFIKRGYALGGTMGLVRSLARRSGLVSSALNINISHSNSSVKHFERLPLLDTKNMGVIFYSRLWNPDKVKDEAKKRQRNSMNEIRIKAVALLKKELGNRFVGGIQLDEYSKKVAGESLVKDNAIVHKRIYLANLRKSHIGVATEGLEGSIGFKLAEYIAMSMAVVSNPIGFYALPGEFIEGKNYLTYKGADECVSQCIKLIEDKGLYMDMCVNNMQYYLSFLSPDKLMLNCLLKSLQ